MLTGASRPEINQQPLHSYKISPDFDNIEEKHPSWVGDTVKTPSRWVRNGVNDLVFCKKVSNNKSSDRHEPFEEPIVKLSASPMRNHWLLEQATTPPSLNCLNDTET